jgi:hypothetical protein
LQGLNCIAIGSNAQGDAAFAGQFNIALGANAQRVPPGGDSIAIGQLAGETNQGNEAVSIGRLAMRDGNNAGGQVAIGSRAGEVNLGGASVAIGFGASPLDAPNNTICINATAVDLNPTAAYTTHIKPIRQMAGPAPDTGFVQLYYNGTTGELAFL